MLRPGVLVLAFFAFGACGSSTVVTDAGAGGGSAAGGGDGGTATGGGGGSVGGGGGATGGGGGATGGGGGAVGGGGGAVGGGGGAVGGGGGTTGGGGGSDAGAPDAGNYLQGGDQCAAAPDVTQGGTFTGTTDDSLVFDDYGPAAGNGCPSGGAGSGRDVAYALSPVQTTQYTVTVTPLRIQFDPMLYVQTTCGGTSCLAGTVLNGPNQPESVTFTVQGGTTAYVIVDGENVSRGPFELTIQR